MRTRALGHLGYPPLPCLAWDAISLSPSIIRPPYITAAPRCPCTNGLTSACGHSCDTSAGSRAGTTPDYTSTAYLANLENEWAGRAICSRCHRDIDPGLDKQMSDLETRAQNAGEKLGPDPARHHSYLRRRPPA